MNFIILWKFTYSNNLYAGSNIAAEYCFTGAKGGFWGVALIITPSLCFRRWKWDKIALCVCPTVFRSLSAIKTGSDYSSGRHPPLWFWVLLRNGEQRAIEQGNHWILEHKLLSAVLLKCCDARPLPLVSVDVLQTPAKIDLISKFTRRRPHSLGSGFMGSIFCGFRAEWNWIFRRRGTTQWRGDNRKYLVAMKWKSLILATAACCFLVTLEKTLMTLAFLLVMGRGWGLRLTSSASVYFIIGRSFEIESFAKKKIKLFQSFEIESFTIKIIKLFYHFNPIQAIICNLIRFVIWLLQYIVPLVVQIPSRWRLGEIVICGLLVSFWGLLIFDTRQDSNMVSEVFLCHLNALLHLTNKSNRMI